MTENAGTSGASSAAATKKKKSRRWPRARQVVASSTKTSGATTHSLSRLPGGTVNVAEGQLASSFQRGASDNYSDTETVESPATKKESRRLLGKQFDKDK